MAPESSALEWHVSQTTAVANRSVRTSRCSRPVSASTNATGIARTRSRMDVGYALPAVLEEPAPQLPWYRPRIERLALFLWGVLGVALVLNIALRKDGWNGVWFIYYDACLRWFDAEPVYPAVHGFLYPPCTLPLFAPFAAIGDTAGCIAFRLFNFAALLGSVLLALRTGFPRPLTRKQGGVFLALLLVPSIGALNQSQINPLILALLIGSAVAAQKERWRIAALLAAFATGIKIYPVAFGLLLCAREPRRFLPWFGAFLAAVFALPYLFHDPTYVTQLYRDLFERLGADTREGDMTFRNVQLILQTAGIPVSATAYLGIEGLAALGVLAVSQRARDLGYALALALCWMTAFGPATEKVTYILAGPVYAFALVRARGTPRFALLALLTAVFLVPQLPIPALLRTTFNRLALPAATTVLMGHLAWRAWRAERR